MTKAELYPYQRVAAEFMKRNNRSGLFLDMGLGKASDDEAVIPTPAGFKKVKDIQKDDYLFDRKGNPTKVLAVYKHTNKKAYRVTLKDGRSFICCDEHIIPYYGYSDAKTISNKTLGDMLGDYKITTSQGYTKYKYRIPKNEPVQWGSNDHIIPPYAMGILIGDGFLRGTSLSISNNEPDVVYKLADVLNIPHSNIRHPKNNYTWAYTNHNNAKIVRDELRRLKLWGKGSREKFIPDSYLIDSPANQRELLKGLIDSDGCVNISHKGAIHYTYSTMNQHLAEQIQSLCLSLGYGVSVNPYVYEDELHDISIRIFTDEVIASSEKHLSKLDKGSYKSIQDKMTPIIDIQEVPPRNMTCFTVDNDEHLYLINDYIVTHNTLIALTALSELAQEGKLYGHILIISPKRIAINTWPDEINKWDHVKGARYEVLAGITKKKRDTILAGVRTAKPTIYIINRELIPKLVEDFPGNQWPFLNVVIDEAQSFKSYKAKGFKALKSIAPYTHRFIELTGTPAPNGLMDIWALIHLLDGGQRLGPNITAYRNAHFNPGRTTPEGYPYEWILKDGHDQVIHDSIKDLVISMTKDDYLTMPPITHNVIDLRMTKSERAVYNQLKKDKVLPLLDGDEINASNAAVLSGALFQLSNGAIYADDTRSDIVELHEHKVNALEEIIDGSNGQPILCFYWFKHDILRLKQKYPDAEVFGESKDQMTRWNAGEIPLLFAHPASAGHGLNFQYGGHIMVFFCVPNSLELYQQSVARLYRNGQKHPVIVHYLRMENTVEEKFITALIRKEDVQNALIDAVKVTVPVDP